MPKLLQDKIIDLDRVMFLVRNELIRAWTKHPGDFNNAHEGHSVLKEEQEELWDHVKHDTAYTADGMKEAIQVAAMGIRFVVDLHDHPKSHPDTRLVLGAVLASA